MPLTIDNSILMTNLTFFLKLPQKLPHYVCFPRDFKRWTHHSDTLTYSSLLALVSKVTRDILLDSFISSDRVLSKIEILDMFPSPARLSE